MAFQAAGKECPPDSYRKEKRDPLTSMMLGFDRKLIFSELGQETAPAMYGTSGSGLWRIGPSPISASNSPKLTAIVIEHHQKTRVKHFLATRIVCLVTELARRYPDVHQAVGNLVGLSGAGAEVNIEVNNGRGNDP